MRPTSFTLKSSVLSMISFGINDVVFEARLRDGFATYPNVNKINFDAILTRVAQDDLKANWPALFDPLVRHAAPPPPSRALSTREMASEAALVRDLFVTHGSSVMQHHDSFKSFICEIHSAIDAGPSRFRQIPVGSARDSKGQQVVFPPYPQNLEILEQIRRFNVDYGVEHPLLASIFNFVGVGHAHPFRDGNGRTARVLLGWGLSHALGRPVYVPANITRGQTGMSLIIMLRRIQMMDDLQPVLEFFLALADLITVSVPNSGMSDEAAQSPSLEPH